MAFPPTSHALLLACTPVLLRSLMKSDPKLIQCLFRSNNLSLKKVEQVRMKVTEMECFV